MQSRHCVEVTDDVGQRVGRLLATAPRRAVGHLAQLIGFGGIDAPQPNTLTADLDGIAVDHRSLANDRTIGCLCGQNRRQSQGKGQQSGFDPHGFALAALRARVVLVGSRDVSA